MRLIKPSYEIITPINGEEILKQIELAARTYYKSEGKIEYTEEPYTDGVHAVVVGKFLKEAKSARVLIPKLISRGHEAMLEFGGNIIVKFICDRGVSHELVRHRIASFAQESTRYCNYSKDEHITFIIPCWLNIKEGVYYTEFDYDGELICDEKFDFNDGSYEWAHAMARASSFYNSLIRRLYTTDAFKTWSPQEARSVLPNSLKTEINISANIREWRHIFRLRTAKAAHPQMRELMCPLLDDFKKQIPILFNDISYESTRIFRKVLCFGNRI